MRGRSHRTLVENSFHERECGTGVIDEEILGFCSHESRGEKSFEDQVAYYSGHESLLPRALFYSKFKELHCKREHIILLLVLTKLLLFPLWYKTFNFSVMYTLVVSIIKTSQNMSSPQIIRLN